jgi:hypothetical protein
MMSMISDTWSNVRLEDDKISIHESSGLLACFLFGRSSVRERSPIAAIVVEDGFITPCVEADDIVGVVPRDAARGVTMILVIAGPRREEGLGADEGAI